MATILLCGVDLFFRGKLDALLPGHHLITTENVDARVWSGIHTRTADTVGVTLGRQVAANALREAYRLFR